MSDDLRLIPKRKLSEAEKQIIFIKIEKMKLEREKCLMILGSAILLFLAFIIVSVIGVLNGIVTKNQLNMLVLGGIFVLIVGVSPYVRFASREQKSLENTLKDLLN